MSEIDALSRDIFHAILNEDLAAVKVFVEFHHIPLTCWNTHKQTPAHVAAYKGNLTILKYLVEHDANALTGPDAWGKSVLHQAAETGCLEMVKYLVDECNMDVYKKNTVFSGNAPIHDAALGDHLNEIKYFIEDKKINVNLSNDLGQPPIFLAAQNSNLDIVKYLYEKHNANVQIIDKENKNILHMCALRADATVAKYLMDEKNLTFDLNLRDSLGYTAIIWASRRKRLDFIKYLVGEKHADVNIQANDGSTALHHAAIHQNKPLVQYLYEHGADLEIKDNEGYTAKTATSDKEVRDYMDELVHKRNRRSTSELFVFPFLDQWNSTIVEVGPSTGKINGNRDDERAADSSLSSILILMDAAIRYFTSSTNRQFTHKALLTPREFTEMRIDPVAVDSISGDIEGEESRGKDYLPRV